jgi:hypothetical protein
MPVTIRVVPLPHFEGLALPAYETADAAGMDLRAAVGEDEVHLGDDARDVETAVAHPVEHLAHRQHGDRRGERHADRHRLAVAQFVVQQRLEGVGEGVAEVEVGPLPPLEFVAAHHRGLDGGGAANQIRQHGRHSSLDGGVVRGDPIQQRRVRDQRMLHALRQTAAIVAR